MSQKFEYGTDGPNMIIAGIDGSESAWKAAAYAAGLARRQQSKLVLVYVQQVGAAAMSQAGGLVYEAGAQVADELLASIKSGAEHYVDLGRLRWEFRTLRGDPANGLLAVAEELRADAIVVGASTTTGHRMFGSVAVRLVKTGRWPVTVVP